MVSLKVTNHKTKIKTNTAATRNKTKTMQQRSRSVSSPPPRHKDSQSAYNMQPAKPVTGPVLYISLQLWTEHRTFEFHKATAFYVHLKISYIGK